MNLHFSRQVGHRVTSISGEPHARIQPIRRPIGMGRTGEEPNGLPRPRPRRRPRHQHPHRRRQDPGRIHKRRQPRHRAGWRQRGRRAGRTTQHRTPGPHYTYTRSHRHERLRLCTRPEPGGDAPTEFARRNPRFLANPRGNPLPTRRIPAGPHRRIRLLHPQPLQQDR